MNKIQAFPGTAIVDKTPSKEMETLQDVEDTIKEMLEVNLGQANTPKNRIKIRQQVQAILYKAQAKGITESNPDVFVYSKEDLYCKDCKRRLYDTYQKTDRNDVLDLDVGLPERQRTCIPCQIWREEMELQVIDYEEIENTFADCKECEQAPYTCGETLRRTIS